MELYIEESRCRRCGRCQQVCPSAVFAGERGGVPCVARPHVCIACGHCVDVCSGDALRHEMFPAENVHEVRRDILPSPESLMELIKSRRSNRTITDKLIPGSAMADILEAARYAPTAENTRRVVVTVMDNAADVQAVEDATMRFFLRLAAVLMKPGIRCLTRRLLPDLYAEAPELERFERRWRAGGRPCVCEAKLLLAFSAPKGYDFGWQDCNLAYQNASLMAEAHGVSQVYMGLVQTAMKFLGTRRTARLLHLPAGHRLYALMALGVPAFPYARYTER